MNDTDFDGEIERELNRVLGSVDGASIPAWRKPAPAGFARRIAGGAGAAIALKFLTGFAVVAFGAAGAVAATEAATTGSLDPTVWGQQVKAQVAQCKAALQSGQHGIGDCVSAFAKQHGQQVSSQHSASSSRENHGNDQNKNKDHGNNGQGNGSGNGNGSNGHGKPSDLPTHP
jgi:hypothetical protein